MTPGFAVLLARWLAYGLAAGTAHFALLRWKTLLYLSDSPMLRALAVQLLRMAATAAALAFATWHGTEASLAAGAGVVLARFPILRLMAVAQ